MQTSGYQAHANAHASARIEPNQISDQEWRGNMMRPEAIRADYFCSDPEQTWSVSRIAVYGKRVLKSGALGSGVVNEYGYNLENAPDWARGWADAAMPKYSPWSAPEVGP